MKTKNITEFFNVTKCRSGSLESYAKGDIPFVSSTNLNNGVEKFVELINEKEIIKDIPCLAMSGFGFCTIQTRAFIGAGNNGAYVKALIPKKKMSLIELAWYATQINLQAWRFSYGRLAIKERVQKLELTEFALNEIEIEQFRKGLENQINKLSQFIDF